jgi:glutaminyl-peptide cyclotransferase
MKISLRFFFAILCLSFVACKSGFKSELGNQAFGWTKDILNFGPRHPGSLGNEKTRKWIDQKVSNMGFTLNQRTFNARTPKGSITMVNLSYLIPGAKHDKKVLLLAHYDSKYMPEINFLGANDAASSVALLLTLSTPIQKMSLPFDVQVVFVDGEEAFVEWRHDDSLYGSRQYVQDMKDRSAIAGVIVVDMIGDKDLSFIRSRDTDEKFLGYLEQSLNEMNQSEKMETHWSYIMDDHTPFKEQGYPVLHLMDFTYGGKSSPGAYWHTQYDTMENISPESLTISGEVILRVLKKIS